MVAGLAVLNGGLLAASASQTSSSNAASPCSDFALTTPSRPEMLSNGTCGSSSSVRASQSWLPALKTRGEPGNSAKPTRIAGSTFPACFASAAVGQVIAMPHRPFQNAARAAAGSQPSGFAGPSLAAAANCSKASTNGGPATIGSIVSRSNSVE